MRYTQFIEATADSYEDAEKLMDEISLRGEVIGTVAECKAEAEFHIKRARPPTDEEMEWANSVARKRGLI